MKRALLLAVLLAGCSTLAPSELEMRFPTLRAEWTEPDAVEAVVTGRTRGRDVGEARIVAFLTAGACPPPEDVPTAWLARNETTPPPAGRFDFEYELRLHARLAPGEPYAVMVNAYRADVAPDRGWCAEFIAGERGPGRPVYP